MKGGDYRDSNSVRNPDGKTAVNTEMIVNEIVASGFQYSFKGSHKPQMRRSQRAMIDLGSKLFRLPGPRTFVVSFAANVHAADIAGYDSQHCQQPALQTSSVEGVYQV
jgi:hypothetical protein